MPITTNLLQSKLKADLEKKLDPVKIGLLATLVLGVGVAMFFMVQQSKVNGAEKKVAALRGEYAKLEPTLKEIQAQRAEDEKLLVTIEALTNRLNKRYFWAPTLEAVLKATPINIQITSFSGTISKPTGAVSISIRGVAAGEESIVRVEAEKFRTNIQSHFKTLDPAATADFPSMLDSAAQVEINGEKVPTIVFTMAVNYVVPSFGTAVPAAAPAAAPPARAPAGDGGDM